MRQAAKFVRILLGSSAVCLIACSAGSLPMGCHAELDDFKAPPSGAKPAVTQPSDPPNHDGNPATSASPAATGRANRGA